MMEPKRDFLMESIQMADGSRVGKIERKHLQALYNAYCQAASQHAQLKALFEQVMAGVKAKRLAAGLSPMPEMPDTLQAKLTPVALSPQSPNDLFKKGDLT